MKAARLLLLGSALACASPSHAAEAPEPTFEDVLAKPDDPELNMRWARRQIKEGDLKGAAATLERLLTLAPREPRLRLLYGMVLFRLDNLPDAERELRELAARRDAPSAVRSEARSTLAALERRRRRLRFEGGLSLGFEYDINRNASPSSGERLFLDRPIDVSGSAPRRDDTAVLLLADVGTTYDLPSAAGHQLYADLTYLRSEQTLVDNLDLQVFGARGGLKARLRDVTLTPSLRFEHVRLSEETFLRNRGGGLRGERRLTSTLVGAAWWDYQEQEFVATTDVPTAPERTGSLHEFSGSLRWALGPSMQLAGTYTHVQKDAKREFNAYERDQLALTHTALLGRGRFSLLYVSAQNDRYRAVDQVISHTPRRDTAWRFRGTFGTPLGFVHPFLQPLIGTVGAEYYHALSTVRNYAYDDFKLSAMLLWRWAL